MKSKWYLMLVPAFFVAGCAVVDDFKDRVYDQNLQSQVMMNQETLLNLVRASRFEPLTFVGIAQLSGGRTEDLKIGLPTITLGPHQTVAQHQYVFSGNLVDSSVTAGFQANPLITTSFQQGMLTPLSLQKLALLVAAHGREPMMMATIEAVSIDNKSVHLTFRNDPSNDGCKIERFAPEKGGAFASDAEYINSVIAATQSKDVQGICKFTKFKAILKALLYIGFSADIPAKPKNADSNHSTSLSIVRKGHEASASVEVPAAQSNAPGASPTADGQFCLDRGLAESRLASIGKEKGWLDIRACGAPDSPKNSGTSIETQAGTLTVQMRSPMGVYAYLAQIMNLQNDKETGQETASVVLYAMQETKDRFGFEVGAAVPMLRVASPESKDYSVCGAEVSYGGRTYCAKDDASTLTLLAMLQDLRNLSITPTDLNSPLSVRVSGS